MRTTPIYSNPLPDKVNVDFHVLGALMLDGIGREVDGANVIGVDEIGGLQWLM